MRKLLISFVAVAMLASGAGCKKSNNTPSNNAFVMFVNACAGTTVDAKAGTNAIPGAGNIAYLANSGYQSVTANTSQSLSFYISSLGTRLTSSTVSLTANDHYTVFAGGIVTASSFLFTADDLTAPASNTAKVRFVNLSSDSLNENCFIGTQKVDSNVTYPSATPYFSVAAATGLTILMSDPAQPAKIAQLASQNFVGGKIYTVVVSGAFSGTGASALKLTIINNN